MVDNSKSIKLFKGLKISIISIIVLALIIFISVFTIKSINTKNFKTYLENNGYKLQKDNSYTKKSKDNDKVTEYLAYEYEFIFSKKIVTTKNYETESILLSYDNKKITIQYQFEGYNKIKEIGILFQDGSYNPKNGEFECKIVTGKNFDSKCDYIKKEAVKFNEELKKIENNNNFQFKYVKQ